jgi:1-acyl-sn-glycerol-3-phosphate acyltransferase
MKPSTPSHAQLASRPLDYRFASWLVRVFARCYFRLRVVGAHHVPLVGPSVLASNHVSYLDPPLVGCVLPRRIHSLARKSLFESAIGGFIIRRLQAVPVDRDGGGGAGLKAILDRLSAGSTILLFPEGTRSPDGEVKTARAGIGLTVIKSDAPVIPVRIVGAFEAMGRHHRFPRPRPITIVFGAPLTFAALRAEAATCDKARLKEIYQQVADELMDAVRQLQP